MRLPSQILFPIEPNSQNLTFKSLRNARGMTLFEILIVLAIIGSLSAILLPMVNDRMKSANVKETKLAMGQVINSLNLYYTDCGHYPKTLDGLLKADPECSNWGPEPYMKKTPVDAWKHEYIYGLDGNQFTLKSLGADGKEGGEGYNKDITQEELN